MDFKETQLLAAAFDGRLDVVENLLSQSVHVDCIDKDGNTPLMMASKNGKAEVVARLLANVPAPDVNAKNKKGGTVLMVACMHVDCLKLILAADPAPELNVVTPGDNLNALMLATFYHRHDCVEVLLQHSVDINARSGEGATALWYAASMGNLPIVKLLLARGADLEISDHRVGAAPLAVAAASGRLEIVDALLTNEPPSSINAQNKNGDTALMMAYASNEMACADRLLNNFPPADSMIANKDGKIALDLRNKTATRSSLSSCVMM